MDLPLDSRPALRDWLVTELSKLLEEPLEDVRALSDEDDLLACGVDSIRIMYVLERLRSHGLVVDFSEFSRQPSLAAWLDLIYGRDLEFLAKETAPAVAAYEQIFELSPVQQAYWIGRSEDEVLGNTSCHAFLEFHCKGIDPNRLEVAVNRLQMRHPMLRAKFSDGFQQILEKPLLPCFECKDWRQLDCSAARRAWAELRQKRSHECLSVDQGQVFMVGLAQLPEGEDRLWLSIDLLAADVESVRVLLNELGMAYTTPEKMVSAPTWHFGEYLARRKTLRLEEQARARQFWLKRLPHLPDAPRLPLDRAPETIKIPRWRRQKFLLCSSDSMRLERFATDHGVTLSSVFGCAFATVLAHWSETNEFLLNVPLFNRYDDDPRVGEVIADFTTLLLIECRMNVSMDFAEAAKAFQRTLHETIDQSLFPALEVLREARRQGQPRSAPVVFSSNLSKDPFIPESFRSVFGDMHDMLSQTPQVWLDHQLYRMDQGILIAWDSIIDFFPAGMLEDMFQAYISLIQRLCDGYWSAPIDLLPWRQRALRTQRNTQPIVGVARCLHHDFFEQATKKPGEAALWVNGHCVSRGELADQALRIAAGLRNAGVGYGDAVEINLPRGPQQVAAVFGVLAAGACYVPLDMDQPSVRRRLIETSAEIVLAIAENTSLQSSIPSRAVNELMATAPLPRPLAVSPQASAYIIYTSGSTGVPKGVEVSHAAAMCTIDAISQLLQIIPEDRLLAVSAIDFDLSVFDLFGVLGAGASLVLLSPTQSRDAPAWAESIIRHGVTLWNSAPALMEMVLSLPAEQSDYRSLRSVLLSGDWVALDLPQRLYRRSSEKCSLYVLGGATEAGIWSNVQKVDKVRTHWRSVPYGQPLPGQAYRVVDEYGNDVPDNVVGELWIGGSSLARKYRNDPELTSMRFVHDNQGRWYRTGDRGRFWSDGTIEFLGRIDQQVKIRGQRIELGEIEAALCASPSVESACALVLGGTTPSLGAALVLRTPTVSKVAPFQLKAQEFPQLAEAEMTVTREILKKILASPVKLPDEIRLRWEEWLSAFEDAAQIEMNQALKCLDLDMSNIATMRHALERVFLQDNSAQELLLDPLLAPQAVAARLPDGREALTCMRNTILANVGNMPLRIAIVDVRAGHWLEYLPLSQLPSGSEITIFDRSRVLLEYASARLHDEVKVQVLHGDLVPIECLGQFDLAISFASLHGYRSSREGLLLICGLLRPQGNLYVIEILRESPLAQLSAALLSKQPLRLLDLSSLLNDFANSGLTANCLWRSDRFALITAKSTWSSLNPRKFNMDLAERLPEAMLPEHVWCLPSLPLNANGKIDRPRLSEIMTLASLQEDVVTEQEQPLNEQEQALAVHWENVLNRSVKKRDSNFFSLGGDSLLATRLLSSIRARFGVQLRMAEFYRCPTLEGMAQQINENTGVAKTPDMRGMEEGTL